MASHAFSSTCDVGALLRNGAAAEPRRRDRSAPAFQLLSMPEQRTIAPAISAVPASYVPPQGYGTYVPPHAPRGGGSMIRRYFSAALRFKWIILLVGMLGTAAGVLFARTIRPVYEVQATLLLAQDARDEARQGPIRAQGILPSAAWVELLRSFVVVDSVVARMRLFVQPQVAADSVLFMAFQTTPALVPGSYELRVAGGRYTLGIPKRGIIEQGVLGDSIGRSIGVRWQPPAALLQARSTVAFSVVTPRNASLGLNQRLIVVQPRETNFLRLHFAGSEPRMTAAILNEWASQFVATAALFKRRNIVEVRATLERQLTQAETTLRNAEYALEQFRAVTITQPSDAPVGVGVEQTRTPVFNAYFQQRSELDDLRHTRQQLESTLAAGGGRLDADALVTLPGLNTQAPQLSTTLNELASKQAQLRAARQLFTDRHPQVQQLMAAVSDLETITIPGLARDLLEQMRRRETELDRRVAGVSRELQRIPQRTIEDMRLSRQRTVAENVYTTLKNRHSESLLAEASAFPDVVLLDAAVPPQWPSDNTRRRIMLLAFIGSFAIAVGCVLLWDRLDPRFRYAEQVTDDLGLSILGTIPSVRASSRLSAKDLEVVAEMREAFRAMRLSLHYAFPGGGPIAFTISSPGSSEGKSLTASNLALAFAEGGSRTVLVDGDARRGELHQTFGVDRVPGLVDYLVGEVALDEVVRGTSFERLSVIPCGTRRQRSPELLSSTVMRDLVMRLQDQFDVVIIDSPPLSAGIDPFALGAATGHLLLVLRTGTTNRHMAEAKLTVLDKLPIRPLGAVINAVQPGGTMGYEAYTYDAKEYAAVEYEDTGSAIPLPRDRR